MISDPAPPILPETFGYISRNRAVRMDFDLSKEQQDIKTAAREFAEIARECDREERYPTELVKKAAELGFIGINLPEEYGGSGYGYLEKCLVTEGFWRVDPGL